ncbi:MAG: galactonate dehydratase [Peptococcaceae bacterium]|nr:galactonate dehydratase [Candidatus Syntrophopropionicum ammoniitolerans]
MALDGFIDQKSKMYDGGSDVTIYGFKRPDNSIGVRNYLGIISCSVCANELATRIADSLNGAVAFTHNQGCCQLNEDLKIVARTLISLAYNPNLYGVIFVSLGCENIDVDHIVYSAKQSGKPVGHISIWAEGGLTISKSQGVFLGQRMIGDASRIRRVEVSPSDLKVGLKCGASDSTSGLITNPSIGIVSDKIIDQGGITVFGEISEFIYAKNLISKRGVTDAVCEQIRALIVSTKERINQNDSNYKNEQKALLNHDIGLTTIEERALGFISKCGTQKIEKVYCYGERVTGRGLNLINFPGREPEALTALAAAGCQVVLLTTGVGDPHGFPFMPIIKVTSNEQTAHRLADCIDLDISYVTEGLFDLEQASKLIYEEMIEVINGKMTKSEINRYHSFMGISTSGLIV